MITVIYHTSVISKLNLKNRKLQIVIGRCKSLLVNEEYQFIQRSTVPTLHFQKSLPRLPIPILENTCSRYLEALRPLLSNEDFQKTEKIVRQFEQKDGVPLNEQLKASDKRNKHTSYISEPWFHMYLSDRKPLPINYNPAMIFINDKNEAYNDQLLRATNLIISSLRFYKSLKANLLEPEVFHLNPKKSDTALFRKVTGFLPDAVSWYAAYLFKAYPLDMSQYSSLFCSTRIPEIGKDKLSKDENSKHLVVLKNGHFYTFDVLDDNGNILEPEVILSNIKYILNDERSNNKSENPVGLLTAACRDEWAKTRKHLETLGNSKALRLIDSSLFVVALDSEGTDEPIKIVKQFIHADGCNRWFDKSFTLIITKNGVAGLNFEHSWGDGVAVLRYFTDIFNDSTTKPRVNGGSSIRSDLKATKLEFIVDDQIKHDIVNTKSRYEKICDSLNVDYLECTEIHKKFCKKHQVSPDALMQLSFQLAYHKLYKKQVTTYESCSTAAFKHGRTEAIRPCTLQTQKFCHAADDPSKTVSNEELVNMIKECSKVHGELTKNAALGQGFDRHLFSLRKIAEHEKSTLPEIYLDKSYALINHNILSTSTLSSDLVLGGGFGPVVNDGYGIAYMIKTDRCGCVITNYSEHTDGAGFKKSVKDSLKQIYAILNASS